VQNGRLCRANSPVVTANNQVPAGDSTAIGKHAESGNDVATPWPKDQEQADSDAKSIDEKMARLRGSSARGESPATKSTAQPVAPTSIYPGASASSTIITDAVSAASSALAGPSIPTVLSSAIAPPPPAAPSKSAPSPAAPTPMSHGAPPVAPAPASPVVAENPNVPVAPEAPLTPVAPGVIPPSKGAPAYTPTVTLGVDVIPAYKGAPEYSPTVTLGS
jgi:hypothetical protein